MAIYIGLEGHDGTGKSATADNLLSLFDGIRLHRTEEMATKRRNLIAKKNNGEFTLSELSRAQDETYREERRDVESKSSSLSEGELVVLDRTWASHAAEQMWDCQEMNELFEHLQKDGTVLWPKDVLKPSITFELYIPEETRSQRVDSRGEKLARRDWNLKTKPEYREALEGARKQLGCVRLSLRARNERIAGLRAAQVILGHPATPPFDLKPKWRQ